MEEENNMGTFEIGHSYANSKTFIPTFYEIPSQNLVYTDMAGLMDTGGPLIDIVNCFACKMLFN